MDSGNPFSVSLTIAHTRGVSGINEVEVMQKLNLSDMLERLDSMHRVVAGTLDASRRASIERHNRNTHITPFKASKGDYVVVARMHGPRTKISANCVAPRRITRILSDFTVEVEHLLTHK